MKEPGVEILAFGEIENEFDVLGIEPELRYVGIDYHQNRLTVWGLTRREFTRLQSGANTPGTDEKLTKNETAWRRVRRDELGMLPEPQVEFLINGEAIRAWAGTTDPDEVEVPEWPDVLTYVQGELDVSLSNLDAVTYVLNSLAYANGLSLSELMLTYHGEDRLRSVHDEQDGVWRESVDSWDGESDSGPSVEEWGGRYLVLDEEGQVLTAPKDLLEFMNIEMEAALKDDFLQYAHPDYLDELAENLNRLYEGEQDSAEIAGRWLGGEGLTFWAQGQAARLKNGRVRVRVDELYREDGAYYEWP